MADFLRESWIWIVAPIVSVLVLLAVLIATRGDDAGSSHVYTLS